jgi:hypothetical protein
MADKVALITGVTIRDAAYLFEFLLVKGYVVLGLRRRHSFNTGRLDHLYQDPHEPLGWHRKVSVEALVQEIVEPIFTRSSSGPGWCPLYPILDRVL